jgi:hypothetical protein
MFLSLKKTQHLIRTFCLGFCCLTLFCGMFSPTRVQAQGVNLEGASGFTACNISPGQSSNSLNECVRAVMQFILVLAGLVALFQLAVAAFNYYNPEVKTDSIQASIDSIRNVFIGLMLITGPVMILNTFNPGLTNLSFIGFGSGGDGVGGVSSDFGNTGGGGGSDNGGSGNNNGNNNNNNVDTNNNQTTATIKSFADLAKDCSSDASPEAKSNCGAELSRNWNFIQNNKNAFNQTQITDLLKVTTDLISNGVNFDLSKVSLGLQGNKENDLDDANPQSNSFKVNSGNININSANKVFFTISLSHVDNQTKKARTQIYTVQTNFSDLNSLKNNKPSFLEPFIDFSANPIKIKSNVEVTKDQVNALCTSETTCKQF